MRKPRNILNLVQKINPLQFIFQRGVYKSIINPGSKKPFEFGMLSEVEDMFQFDINQHPRTFEGLYNEKEGKLNLTFWGILMSTKRICLLHQVCLFVYGLCPIMISYFTKIFLLELEKNKTSQKDLLWLVSVIFLLGVTESIFDANQTLFYKLQTTKAQNLIKVRLIEVKFNARDQMIQIFSASIQNQEFLLFSISFEIFSKKLTNFRVYSFRSWLRFLLNNQIPSNLGRSL